MYNDEVHKTAQKTKEKVEKEEQAGKTLNEKLVQSYRIAHTSAAFWARFFQISQSTFKGTLNKDQKILARSAMCLGDAFQCFLDLGSIHATISSDAKKRKRLFVSRSNWISHMIEGLLRVYGSDLLKVDQANTITDAASRAERENLKTMIKEGTKSMKLCPIVEGPLLILEERLSCLPNSMRDIFFTFFPDLRYIRDSVSVMVVMKVPPVLMMLSLTVSIGETIHSMVADHLLKEKKERVGSYPYLEYVLPCWNCLRGSCWSALIKEFNVDAADPSVFTQLSVGGCRIAMGDERTSQMIDPLRISNAFQAIRQSTSTSTGSPLNTLPALPEVSEGEEKRSQRAGSVSSSYPATGSSLKPPTPRSQSASVDSICPELGDSHLPRDTLKGLHPSGWEEMKTPDGKVYYFNRKTNETDWEMPDALRSARSPSHIKGTSGDWNF